MCKCLQIICAKYYELRYMFYLKIAPRQSCRVCLIQHQNLRYFRRPVWKTKSWQKSKPTRKLKHANFILEYFDYFCQMSSKSIAIILSYTVSKFARFFETQCKMIVYESFLFNWPFARIRPAIIIAGTAVSAVTVPVTSLADWRTDRITN